MLKRTHLESQGSKGDDVTKKKKGTTSTVVTNNTSGNLICSVVIGRISTPDVNNSDQQVDNISDANDTGDSVEPSLVMSVDECPVEVKTEPMDECCTEYYQDSVSSVQLTDNDESSVPVFRSVLSLKSANQQTPPVGLSLSDTRSVLKTHLQFKTGASGTSLRPAIDQTHSASTLTVSSTNSSVISKPPLNVTAIVLRCAAPGTDVVSGAEAAARLLAKHQIQLGKSTMPSCHSGVSDNVIQQPPDSSIVCENVDKLKELLVESNRRKFQLAKELEEAHQNTRRMNQQLNCLRKVVIELHRQLQKVDPNGCQEFTRNKLLPLRKELQGMNVEGILHGV